MVASSIEVASESNGGEQTSNRSPKVSRKSIHYQGVQPEKLRPISLALNRHLNHLMAMVTEKEEDRNRLRRELHASRERIHQLHHHCCSFHNPSANIDKPNSSVSVSEGMYGQESG
ncbi:uncharacterized protein LOC106477109 [Limulus polyphemus]|uniref:Uncharacterized protein LOC106477109 n=1 Tax=Limulus polyphemus TaxID=6850 RepID=A0ABM1RYP6_LIMPO|nr:uncharacterized protein LOC106477109 [Limulus polyphemus]